MSCSFSSCLTICVHLQMVHMPLQATKRFSKLSSTLSMESGTGGTAIATHLPIGLDPVFQIWSNLWSLALFEQENEYYNMTKVGPGCISCTLMVCMCSSIQLLCQMQNDNLKTEQGSCCKLCSELCVSAEQHAVQTAGRCAT